MKKTVNFLSMPKDTLVCLFELFAIAVCEALYFVLFKFLPMSFKFIISLPERIDDLRDTVENFIEEHYCAFFIAGSIVTLAVMVGIGVTHVLAWYA